ncbi:MAG: hypothetical protein M3021_02745, partial [Actinomycetota bacterium]|nr:hypothetical protein [Actinomycetota bacterium]
GVGLTVPPDWLPPLVRLEDHEDNLDRHLDAVYGWFRQDFFDHQTLYQGMPCAVRATLAPEGREAGFWHLVTSTDANGRRNLATNRLERIRWIRAVIESAGTDRVASWRYQRNGEERVACALADFSYFIGLVNTGSLLILVTAFPVQQEHTRRKLRREYEGA